jgi:hypothetical protein
MQSLSIRCPQCDTRNDFVVSASSEGSTPLQCSKCHASLGAWSSLGLTHGRAPAVSTNNRARQRDRGSPGHAAS